MRQQYIYLVLPCWVTPLAELDRVSMEFLQLSHTLVAMFPFLLVTGLDPYGEQIKHSHGHRRPRH